MPKKISPPTKKRSAIKEPSRNANTKGHGFTVSFSQLDHYNQGAKAEDIEKGQELAHTIKVFNGFGNRTVEELKRELGDEKFCVYGDFPPKDRTDYTHPVHVPEDAKWTRIHITGKYCAIGHVLDDVFYFVFFDNTHAFWKSKLKHT